MTGEAGAVRSMHVITRKRLLEFGRRHPEAETPLDVWYRLLKAGRFTSWAALKQAFGAADSLGRRLVVFDIGGNTYRVVANVRYASATNVGRVWVRHVFTHAQYDRWARERRR
jgi:mRNA interferase HigB